MKTSKLENKQRCIVLATLSAMTLMCASAADSGNFDDEAWRAQRATYDLLDREKMLLKADDELGQRIYDIKQNIKTLSEALNTSQSERDRVRHELIIVRVKLLH